MPLPPTRLSPGGGTVVTFTNLQTRVERDRARSEALAFITHELRTPLASIQGFADLLIRYPGSPDCEGAPDTILSDSKRLLALIHSYLDVLRLDAVAKPLEPMPWNSTEQFGRSSTSAPSGDCGEHAQLAQANDEAIFVTANSDASNLISGADSQPGEATRLNTLWRKLERRSRSGVQAWRRKWL